MVISTSQRITTRVSPLKTRMMTSFIMSSCFNRVPQELMEVKVAAAKQ